MMRWELLAALLCLAGIRSGASYGFSDPFGDPGTGFGFFGSFVNPAESSSQSDAMYLIVKVDLVSSSPPNSSLTDPLLDEVKRLLETGFSTGTFQLSWVAYEARAQ